jgi:hypothetical protein
VYGDLSQEADEEWGFGLSLGPTYSCGLKIEATAGLGLAPTSNPGPEFLSSTLAQHPPKISTTRKYHRNLLVSRLWKLSPTSTRHQTAKMADSDSPVTLRTRKFIRNPLLGRKQMVV